MDWAGYDTRAARLVGRGLPHHDDRRLLARFVRRLGLGVGELGEDFVDPADHLCLTELLEAGAQHLIASWQGRDVGLLTVERVSPAPRLCPDGAHVGPTATRPEMRGRGVGRALVDAVKAQITSRDIAAPAAGPISSDITRWPRVMRLCSY